jgi:hypothetical protein
MDDEVPVYDWQKEELARRKECLTRNPGTELTWEEVRGRYGRSTEQSWDQQIEEDLEAGRLDTLIAEVTAEYEAGSAHPL